MNSKSITYGILRAVAILAGIALLGYFLFQIRSILIYIVVAAVIALIGRPLVYFFTTRLHIPNTLAALLTLLLISAIALGIVALFIPVFVQQSENFRRIDFETFKASLNYFNHQVRDYFNLKQMDLFESLINSDYLRNFLNFQSIPSFMSSVFGKVGAILIAVLAVLFISFFFLTDRTLLFNSILVFAKKGSEDRFTRIFNKIRNLLSRYFIGLSLQIFILFVFYVILLLLFDVQNPIAVAFLSAFLNIIPYLGPLFAGVLLMIFVASSNIGADFETVILPRMLYVLAGYIVTQIIDGIINQPMIFGQSVKSHPLEVFLVILIAALLTGVFGMIIAVPFYTALKVIAQEVFSKYKLVRKLTQGL